jgi:hypothetical protein
MNARREHFVLVALGVALTLGGCAAQNTQVSNIDRASAQSRPLQLAMSCPIGSHPWTDAWGNPTCQSFATGQNITTQANPVTGCPNGAAPSIDNWGNRVCQNMNGGATYYDTSRGCPVGTHPWRDNWGNPICQRF